MTTKDSSPSTAVPRSVDGLDGRARMAGSACDASRPARKRVIDLGCGFGWFCRWARENGAAHVLGVDVSEKMLERAKGETHYPLDYLCQNDMEHLELPAGVLRHRLQFARISLHRGFPQPELTISSRARRWWPIGLFHRTPDLHRAVGAEIRPEFFRSRDVAARWLPG